MAEELTVAPDETTHGDPFANYGGKAETNARASHHDDPFAKYGGSLIPKKAGGAGSPPTSTSLPNGLNPFQSSQASTPYSGITTTPQMQQQLVAQDEQVRQQRQAQQDALNKQLKPYFDKLSPQEKADLSKHTLNSIVAHNNEQLSQPSDQEINDYNKSQTTTGKILNGIKYLGSKATKGALQVVKGAAYLADIGAKLQSPTTAINAFDGNHDIDKAFTKADKATDFLSKGDQSRVEDSKAMANLGGLAEFLPSAMAAESTGGATFYLQGLGQGKETIDKVEESGAKINPVVKNAFILGTGAVNGLLMGELGGSLFKSLPSTLKNDVVASITTKAIKDAAGKEITAQGFKDLLESGAKDWKSKVLKGGAQYLENTQHAITNLSALNVGNFALKQGVDVANDKPVFNENLGDLANQEGETLKVAPAFGALGSLKDISKLTPYSHYKNTVVESLMNDPSEKNVSQVKQDFSEHAERNPQDFTPEETKASLAHIDELAKIAKSLPRGIHHSQVTKAVDLVQNRNEMQTELDALKENRDPALTDVHSPGEQLLVDKIDQANDKLSGLVKGKKVTYTTDEEKDKFYKNLPDGKRVEIPKSRYNLEKTEGDAKVKANEQTEPNQEVSIEAPTNEPGKEKEPITATNEPTENNLTPISNESTNEANGKEVSTESNGESSKSENDLSNAEKEVAPSAGSVNAEPVTKEENLTSIKNSKIDEDRAKRGLSPLMSEAKKDFGTVWDNAMKRLEEKPNASRDLVDNLEKKPRATTDEENALITHHLVETKNEYDKLNEAIVKAQDAGKDTSELSDELDTVSDRLHKIENVSRKVGTETGRGLNSRKMMLKDDMSLARLETITRVSKGRALTNEEREQLREVVKQHEAKQKEYEETIAKLEERNRKLQEDATIRNLKYEARKEQRGQAKSQRVKNRQDLVQDIRTKLKLARKETNAVIIPYAKELAAIAPELAKLAKSYIADGITTLEGLVDKIHNDLLETIPDISKRAVRDALSGYDKEVQPQTKSQVQKSLEELKKQAKLISRIEDLESGEKPKDAKKLAAKSEEVQKLTKQVRELSQNDISLKALKTRTANQIAELQRKLQDKDFSTAPPRKPIDLDPEAIKAKAALERVKKEFDLEREKDRLLNRSSGQKVVDKLLKYRRGLLLTSIPTIAKIGMAATYRILGTPLHEITGSILNKFPLSRISKLAPREGNGFSIKAEKSALSSIWDKNTWEQAGRKMKGKLDDLDIVFGGKKEHAETGHWLWEIFGNIHGSIKEFAKYNEFNRSVKLREDFAKKNGLNIEDPLVQLNIGMSAYKDANRSIFMSDNWANDRYRRILKDMDVSKNNWDKIAAPIFKFFLPIVKVPTNYLVEKAQYIPVLGGMHAASLAAKSAAHVFFKGISELTPDQADYVLRIAKKQSIGSALLVLGYLHPQNFGGFYTRGNEKEDDELHPNDIEIYGVKIPHFLTHTPLLSILQMGATIRNAKDSWEASIATANDLVGTTPFYSTPKELMKTLEGEQQAKGVFGDLLRSLIVPPDVKSIAELRDKDENGEVIKRHPETVLEGVEQGIPVLRENVPIKNPHPEFNKIHLGENTYKLNNDQIQERQKYYSEYLKSESAKRLLLAISKAKNTEEKKKLQQRLRTIATNYSKGKILHAHHNAQTGGYNLSKEED